MTTEFLEIGACYRTGCFEFVATDLDKDAIYGLAWAFGRARPIRVPLSGAALVRLRWADVRVDFLGRDTSAEEMLKFEAAAGRGSADE